MEKAKRIINISSIFGIADNRGQTNYSAAKGALNAATKSLSQEVASLVAYLTSDEVAYITGQVISINGGML